MYQQINFYSFLIENDQKILFSGKKFLTIVAFFIGILLAVIVFMFFYLYQSTTRLTEVKKQLLVAQQTVDGLILKYPGINQANELSVIQQKRQEVYQLQSTLLTGRNPADVLTALSQAILPGVWLESIVITAKGERIELRGKALQSEMVHQFVNQLNQQSIFSDLSLQVATLTKENIIIDKNTVNLIDFQILSGKNNE